VVTYVVFSVEIGAEFENRAHDATFGGFTCVMKRRFSSFLEILCSDHKKCQADVHLSHLSRHREKTNLVSYVGIFGPSPRVAPRPVNDLVMTPYEVRSVHTDGITTPPTKQHPLDPRHIHRQKSATRLQIPTNLVSRIGISAGLEEQLHDRRMTP
jgi:hypothetical protein